MTFAAETRDRRYADRILLGATRWLGRQDDGEDPVIREAREQLRAEFPRSTSSLRAAPALLLALFAGVRVTGSANYFA
jgi:hypothetical protein